MDEEGKEEAERHETSKKHWKNVINERGRRAGRNIRSSGGERRYGASSFKFQRESLRIFDTFGVPMTTFLKSTEFMLVL